MRPIAIVAKAFTGCRTKIHALYEQIYGKDCVDIYCKEGCHNDHEIESLSLSTYSHFGTSELESINAHEIIHVFCDCCDFFFDLMKLNRAFILHRNDIFSMRGSIDNAEKIMHQSPLVLSVFTSEKHQAYVHNLTGIGESYILYNLPVMAWQPELPQQEAIENTLVYFGSVKMPGNRPFSYRCYLPQFLALASHGIKVHIYATGGVHPRLVEVYGRAHPNIVLHPRVPHSSLYAEMSKYRVGFAGYNDINDDLKATSQYARTCVPNKAFDYMFAGIPTLAYNLGESEKFVSQWGVCVDGMYDLMDGFRRATEMTIDYEKFRKEYCSETSKPLLRKLSERVRVKQ